MIRFDIQSRRLTSTIFAITVLAVGVLASSSTKADTLPVIEVSGTLLSSQTWANDNVYHINNSVTIPDEVTLTIEPGTVIKTAMGWGLAGIVVESGGSLNAAGSSTSPIIFTSYRDDSYGGDTNGDGVSQGVLGDYPAAIGISPYFPNGEVSVSYAKFLYGSRSISINCNYSDQTSVSVTDSEMRSQFKASACPKDSYQLARNQFQLASSDNSAAVELVDSDPSGVVLSGTDTNILNGTGKARAVTVIAGNSNNSVLPLGSSWSVSGVSNAVLDVYNMGVSGDLNLGEGAVIKANSNSNAVNVKDGGSLNVAGSAGNPVTFTSYKNDLVGGDTNGDGNSTATSDDYNSAIKVDGGGNTVSVNYARFEYGGHSVQIDCNYDVDDNTVALVDNTLNAPVGIMECAQDSPNIAKNQFNVSSTSSNSAVYFQDTDPNGLVLAGANQNIFNGTGKSAEVSIVSWGPEQNKINSNTSWTVSGDGGAVLHMKDLYVEGNLIIQPGAIIKVDQNGRGLRPKAGGSVVANGTAASPIIVTSYKDDTIGGDTNGDGNSSPSAADFISSIYTPITPEAGTIDINHVEFRHGIHSFEVNCASEMLNVTVNDSKIKSGAQFSYCQDNPIELKRNEFVLATDTQYHALSLSRSNPSGVAMDGVDKNIFVGTGKSRLISVDGDGISSQLPEGSAWTVSGSTNGVIWPSDFLVAGALNLVDGSIIKSDSSNGGIRVQSGGELHVTGSMNDRVVFTSMKDDNYGGDSNEDGSSTVPAVNDYGTAIKLKEGSNLASTYMTVKYSSLSVDALAAEAHISNGIFAYNDRVAGIDGSKATFLTTSVVNTSTSPAIYLEHESKVTYRGSFNNVTGKAIQSCNWSSNSNTCSVDASYADWGSSTGPFDDNNSANDMVCGAVFVSPWIYSGVEHPEDDVHGVQNCDGSTTPSTAVADGATHFGQRVAARQIDCSNGFQAACDAIENAYACLGGAMDVAQSTAPWPLPPSDTPAQIDALGGVIRSSAADYLTSQAHPSPIGHNLSFFNQLISVTGTVLTIGSAYNSCAP